MRIPMPVALPYRTFLLIAIPSLFALLCPARVHSLPPITGETSRMITGSERISRERQAGVSGHSEFEGNGVKREAGEGERMCELERRFIEAGLVNIKDIDPTIMVELKYSSTKNFMREDVYGDLKDAYLRREAAMRLKKANELLKRANPNLTLLVADACRPRSVQRRMYAIVRDTSMRRYVAHPEAVSMHNYGVAVDVTIADEKGNRLDMGCPMDHFGILSHPSEEMRFLREGVLTEQQVSARRLLRDVMTRAGFQVLSIEWWHFNACDRKVAAKKYGIIE